MDAKITYYLDTISSWCFWAEPAWAELRQRFAGRVEFGWKIALMDPSGLPVSHSQEEWFYRRSGVIMRSPFMLQSAWFEPGTPEYVAPNAVAEAAHELGVGDDHVRLALARAAVIDGRKVGHWDIAVEVGAAASGLDAATLQRRAQSPEIDARLRASTAEFHALQVTQRPTFVLDDVIGDRAVFSGLVQAAPIAAALEAMLSDTAAYASYAAHYGAPPTT